MGDAPEKVPRAGSRTRRPAPCRDNGRSSARNRARDEDHVAALPLSYRGEKIGRVADELNVAARLWRPSRSRTATPGQGKGWTNDALGKRRRAPLRVYSPVRDEITQRLRPIWRPAGSRTPVFGLRTQRTHRCSTGTDAGKDWRWNAGFETCSGICPPFPGEPSASGPLLTSEPLVGIEPLRPCTRQAPSQKAARGKAGPRPARLTVLHALLRR